MRWRRGKAETRIQRAILDYAKARGLPLWRNQAGMVQVRRGWMHLAPEGSPDLVGLTPAGRFLAVEVKTSEGELSPAQVEWRRRIETFGGLYVLARTVDDVARVFSEAA